MKNKMKKKVILWVAMVLGVALFLGGSPTEADASSKAVYNAAEGASVEMMSITKQTCVLKGEARVRTTNSVTTKYAKITVFANGSKYYDCCSKFVRTVPVVDGKGALTGEYDHIYKFCGCRKK